MGDHHESKGISKTLRTLRSLHEIYSVFLYD